MERKDILALMKAALQVGPSGTYSYNGEQLNKFAINDALRKELKNLSDDVAENRQKAYRLIEEAVSDVDMVRMDQNNPNPFSESTVISLNIPDKTQTASIFIYDMSGKQVHNIAVSERGETNITVYASELTAGMYIYTLVVDGKVVVTRRMIVSKN